MEFKSLSYIFNFGNTEKSEEYFIEPADHIPRPPFV